MFWNRHTCDAVRNMFLFMQYWNSKGQIHVLTFSANFVSSRLYGKVYLHRTVCFNTLKISNFQNIFSKKFPFNIFFHFGCSYQLMSLF